MTIPLGGRRALLGGLCGLAAVLVPLGLAQLASARLHTAIARDLQGRLGGQVTLERVRLVGLGTLRIDGLAITWPTSGRGHATPAGSPCQLTAEGIELGFALSSLVRLRPALSRVSLYGGSLRWERPEALSSLMDLTSRARGKTPDGETRQRDRGRTRGARISLHVDSVLIREVRHRGPKATGAQATQDRTDPLDHPDHMETRSVKLSRSPDGRWRGTLGRVLLGLYSGARMEMRDLSWRGRDRPKGGGLRFQWLRVGGGHFMPPGEAPPKAFRLVADELAPDLLQIRLEAAGTTAESAGGEALRLHADLDSRKGTLRSRLAVASLRLGSLYPWPSPLGLGLRDTQVTGSVELHGWGRRQLEVRSRTLVSGLALRHRRVAPQPVVLPPMELQGSFRLDGHRLTLENGTLQTGEVKLDLEGELSQRLAGPQGHGSRGLTANVRITLPPTHCDELLAALPPALTPTLQGMKLAGTLGGHLRVTVDSGALDDLTLDARVHPNACQVLEDAPRADVSALRRPFAFVIRPPGWPATRLEMGPKNPHWVPYANLGRNVIGAFLAAEDRNFFDHRGFDLENIRRALVEDLRVKGFAKGASSISQQVAKNVFLDHRRNLSRKLEEAVLTWRLEDVLDKRRILEIYLNLVEMGPGIFGVRAASRHYFQRDPMNLDPLQAAHLAAITPHPRASHDRFRQGRAGMDWLLHLRFLLFQMHRLGWVTKPTYEQYRQRDLRLISY